MLPNEVSRHTQSHTTQAQLTKNGKPFPSAGAALSSMSGSDMEGWVENVAGLPAAYAEKTLIRTFASIS